MIQAHRAHTQQLVADGIMAVRIATAWLVSMILPAWSWRLLTRTIAGAAVRLQPGWRRGQLAELDRRFGPGHVAERRRILADRIAFGHESRLYGLREYRPGRREHRIRVVGGGIVRESLAAGEGVILWVARFAFASVIAKIGLHQAGFHVSHLSRPTHGFATSPRGVRWLNPVWTRIEARYLRERIVMLPECRTAALRALRARLAENQVVSITVGDEGVQTVTVPFFRGDLRLATGPISLAANAGAPLIPVFTVRTAPGEFTVELQPPLEFAANADRETLFKHVGVQYARRLAPFVERYPGQWLG